MSDVLLTTEHRVDVWCFTDHWAQGGCTTSYWPLSTGWMHNILLTTEHRVDTQCLTDHHTGWIPDRVVQNALLTTHLDKPCFTDCQTTGWRLHCLLFSVANCEVQEHLISKKKTFLNIRMKYFTTRLKGKFQTVDRLIVFHLWSIKLRAFHHCVISYIFNPFNFFPTKIQPKFSVIQLCKLQGSDHDWNQENFYSLQSLFCQSASIWFSVEF